MVQRRPLVLVSGAPSQLPPGDTLLVPSGSYSEVVAGSGLIGGGNIANDIRLDIALAAQASGLVFGSDNRLGLDGSAKATADAALASGNAAIADVQSAQASGNAALVISVEALASGNAALADASTAQASGNAALVVAVDALASGNAALAESEQAQLSGNYAIDVAEDALASGNAALVITPAAQASGNAALLDIANSPSLTQADAIALIVALS